MLVKHTNRLEIWKGLPRREMHLISFKGGVLVDEPSKGLSSVNTVNFLGSVGSSGRRVLDRAYFKDIQMNIIEQSNIKACHLALVYIGVKTQLTWFICISFDCVGAQTSPRRNRSQSGCSGTTPTVAVTLESRTAAQPAQCNGRQGFTSAIEVCRCNKHYEAAA